MNFHTGFLKHSLRAYKSLFTVWSGSPSKCYFQLSFRRRRIGVWKTWAHAARAVIRANLRQSACWFSSSVTDIKKPLVVLYGWVCTDRREHDYMSVIIVSSEMLIGNWLRVLCKQQPWMHSRNSLTLEMGSRKLGRNLMGSKPSELPM